MQKTAALPLPAPAPRLPARVEALPGHATRVSTDKGAVEYAFPRRNVMLARYTGTSSLEHFRHVTRAMTERLAVEPRLTLFADFEHIDGFDVEFREAWVHWFRLHRGRIAGLHILFRSRLVAIGVGIVGLVLGADLSSYRERTPFELALEGACGRGTLP